MRLAWALLLTSWASSSVSAAGAREPRACLLSRDATAAAAFPPRSVRQPRGWRRLVRAGALPLVTAARGGQLPTPAPPPFRVWSPPPVSTPPPPPPPPGPGGGDGPDGRRPGLPFMGMLRRNRGPQPRIVRRNLLVAYMFWFLSLFGTFGLHHIYLDNQATAYLRSLTFGGLGGLGVLSDLLSMHRLVAVRNGRRRPALPARDTVRFYLSRCCDGYLGATLLGRPFAAITALPEHVCKLAGCAIGTSLSSISQGFLPSRAALAGTALVLVALAVAEVLTDARRTAAADLLLHLAHSATVPFVLLHARLVGRPVPMSALRSTRARRAPAFALSLARYSLSVCAYWLLLLYGSDNIVAIEVYMPGKETLRLSVGRFLLRMARVSTLSAAAEWLRGALRPGATPRPMLHFVRQAIQEVYGPFSQLCATLVGLEATRSGRELPRFCCSAADFGERERALRPSDARRILGVGPLANAAAIRKAYRKLALRYHPDKLSSQGERARAVAEREFLRVQQAYQLLTDRGKGDA